MDAQELKTVLQTVRANNFEPPSGVVPTELLPAMLDNLGSPDPELRDRLIYSTFVYWIEYRHKFGPNELRTILNTVLDEQHLWREIDVGESDAIFTRSFSVLLVPLLLIYHREHPYLSQDEVINLKQQVIKYLATEHDLRGLVPDKGWAHATAHTADALNELALCDELGKADLIEILEGIRGKFGTTGSVFIHAEDERLIEVIGSVLERELVTKQQWADWLHGFATLPALPEPADYYQFINLKNFLQSLYFRGYRATLPDYLTSAVATTLADMIEEHEG